MTIKTYGIVLRLFYDLKFEILGFLKDHHGPWVHMTSKSTEEIQIVLYRLLLLGFFCCHIPSLSLCGKEKPTLSFVAELLFYLPSKFGLSFSFKMHLTTSILYITFDDWKEIVLGFNNEVMERKKVSGDNCFLRSLRR